MVNEKKTNSKEYPGVYREDKERVWQSKLFYAISLGSALGFLTALPLILFLFFGLWLDKKFNTTPLFLILFIVLGFMMTIFEIRYFVLPFLEKRSLKVQK